MTDEAATPGVRPVDGAQRVIATVADLRAYSQTGAPNVVLRQYFADGPAIDSVYDLDTTDTTTTDDGVLCIVATDGGRWKLRHDGQISFKQAGAYGDNKTDDSAAIQRMLNTGLAITPDVTSIFRTLAPLTANGQKIPAGTKFYYPPVSQTNGVIAAVDSASDRSGDIRAIIVENDGALQSFVAMKSLGFNSVLHYVHIDHGNGAYPTGWAYPDVTVAQIAANTLACGLDLVVSTEYLGDTQSAWQTIISAWDSYPHVVGYYMYDEPVLRGITVANQDAKIAFFKQKTIKWVACADFNGGMSDNNGTWGAVFGYQLSMQYDIVFVDTYSRTQDASLSASQLLENDLRNMRTTFASMKAASGGKRTIPCIGLFTSKPGQLYTSNVSQMLAASQPFAQIAQGSYCAFVWDGYGDASINARVMSSTRFWNAALQIFSQRRVRKTIQFVMFGDRVTANMVWPGLEDLQAQTSKLSDIIPSTTNQMTNGMPSEYLLVKSGASNGIARSGLLFRKSGESWKSSFNIPAGWIVTYKFLYFEPGNGAGATMTVSTSNDNWKTSVTVASNAVTHGSTYSGSTEKLNQGASIGVELSGFTASPTRTFGLSGLLIFSDF